MTSAHRRLVFPFVCLVLIVCGCASRASRVIGDADVVGAFRADFDFRAEARIHLRHDHTFEMYSVTWRTLRTRPASEVRESGARDSGRWLLKGRSVGLISGNGVSTSLKIQVDRDAVFLVGGGLRYRMVDSEERIEAPQPVDGPVTFHRGASHAPTGR